MCVWFIMYHMVTTWNNNSDGDISGWITTFHSPEMLCHKRETNHHTFTIIYGEVVWGRYNLSRTKKPWKKNVFHCFLAFDQNKLGIPFNIFQQYSQPTLLFDLVMPLIKHGGTCCQDCFLRSNSHTAPRCRNTVRYNSKPHGAP